MVQDSAPISPQLTVAGTVEPGLANPRPVDQDNGGFPPLADVDAARFPAWRPTSAFGAKAQDRNRPIADHQRTVDASDMPDTVALSANFFVHCLRYDVGSLTVTLEVGGEPYVELQFDPPRAFRSYSESDFHQYLATFRGDPILKGRDADVGVFMSEDAPYVVEYRKHARPAEPETTFSCLIATPQECVEVVCFEKPTVRFL